MHQQFFKNLWVCSQTIGYDPTLVDLALKGKAQVLPEVGVDGNMEECIFQVQRYSPVHGPDGVPDEGWCFHFDRRFHQKSV